MKLTTDSCCHRRHVVSGYLCSPQRQSRPIALPRLSRLRRRSQVEYILIDTTKADIVARLEVTVLQAGYCCHAQLVRHSPDRILRSEVRL